MSPVAHAGLGLLGWQLFDQKKTAGTLGLFVLVANWPDVDFLLHLLFRRPIAFLHQYYTHNILFVLVFIFLFSLFLRDGRSRLGIYLTGISHLLSDLIVIDTSPPIGIRLFFPFSNSCFNLPWFPYLRRWPSKALFSVENGAVLLLEFVVFVLPVVYLFRKQLQRRWSSSAFWKI
jgi:membrane-bound metal-dependent hydrolase YbcI (DUF457 family)